MASSAIPSVTLGTSGSSMPVIGLGTWRSPAAKVTQAVNCAIEAGYRHIDCAYIYGNEVNVGTALKEQISRGNVKREDMFIVSKLWATFHSAEDVKPALQESLKNLGVEYLDLYLIHWPVPRQRGCGLDPKYNDGSYRFADTPTLETWTAMEKCVDEGLVKNVGLSNFNSIQVQNVIDNCRIKPSVLQVEIHPYMSQEKLVKFCHDRDIVITAYSPLGSSDIVGASPEFTNLLGEPVLKTLGTKYGKSPAQIFDFQLTTDDMETVSGLNKNHRFLGRYFLNDDGTLNYSDLTQPLYPFPEDVEF